MFFLWPKLLLFPERATFSGQEAAGHPFVPAEVYPTVCSAVDQQLLLFPGPGLTSAHPIYPNSVQIQWLCSQRILSIGWLMCAGPKQVL